MVRVDVRGAIGGEPSDAAAAAALFTGPGTMAKAVSRKVAIPSKAPVTAPTGRTVLLTDESTRSLVTRRQVDDCVAATVASTVGMAIVQRAVTTESGGTLYMTVARYVSPSGTPLAGKGLSPDDRVIVFADQSAGGKSPAGDPILDRGLEVARGAVPRRAA